MLSHPEKLHHVDSWKRGHLTQSQYCLLHNLKLGTFKAWVRDQAHLRTVIKPSRSLVPVDLVTAKPVTASLRIECPSGHVLHVSSGMDLDWVGALLRGLA